MLGLALPIWGSGNADVYPVLTGNGVVHSINIAVRLEIFLFSSTAATKNDLTWE